jgi:hypothetical protein
MSLSGKDLWMTTVTAPVTAPANSRKALLVFTA